MERLKWPKAEIDSTLHMPKISVFEAVSRKGIRPWLSLHSILYRRAKFHLAEGLRNLEMKLSKRDDSDVLIIDDREHRIHTGFTPRTRLGVLDLNNRQISAGLEISLQTLAQMDAICRERGIKFLVALIPTKESVYAPYVQDHSSGPLFRDFRSLVEEERQVNNLLKDSLSAMEIRFVDCLPALREAVLTMPLYPSNQDGHPNRAGYSVIAHAIAQNPGLLNGKDGKW